MAAMSVEPVLGSFEVHLFVEPLNPSAAQVESFRAACAAAPVPMKALLLELDYVGRGFVGVLQSSRYVTGDVAAGVEAAHHDARALREAGFVVLREKVEAVAQNEGVPRTAADAERSPEDRYFEFHLLVDGRDGPLSEADMVSLRALAERYTARLASPVPLSYNALKPAQRFLNFRARRQGLEQALRTVEQLSEEVRASGALFVKKVIGEYICFDSNRAVDNGWLEPLDG